MLNYDDFDLSPYLTVNEIGRPILPPQNVVTKSITGRAGAYFIRKDHEPIEIPVEITVNEKEIPDYRKRIRFLSEKLNKDEPKRIIFSDEPDIYIKGILTGDTPLDEVLTAGQGEIVFLCPDPFYYEIEDEVFTFAEEGEHNFTREKGNTESLPIIEIEGTNETGIITIETDHTEINFDGVLKHGEVLTFDSDLITSYIVQNDGTKRSGNNDIDTMNFPFLLVGANRIKVTTSGGAKVDRINIYSRSRWT